MLSDEKDLIKKLTKLMTDTKKQKITDFDTGLLEESFEHITGKPSEKFDRYCDKLINIATRIENLKQKEENGKYDKILDEVEYFLENVKLPYISTEVNDYKQKSGRYITIKRSDVEGSSESCEMENFDKRVDIIRDEQYFVLTVKTRHLIEKAKPYLDDVVFSWHKKHDYKLTIPSVGEIRIAE